MLDRYSFRMASLFSKREGQYGGEGVQTGGVSLSMQDFEEEKV